MILGSKTAFGPPFGKFMSQHKARQGRRDIYLGEKFKSWVSYRGLTIPANFVSLSREGLGVAVEHDDGNEFDLHAKVVVKVTLTSRSEFSFSASVRNIEKFVSVGKKYMRIGLEIDHVTTTGPEGFTSESGHAFFPADSAIKPLCSGISPLFFKDRIVFNTIGFTLHGMIVQPQGHKKFLLPGQQITIKLTLPGGKGHTVKTQVSVYLVKNPTQDFETAYYLTFAEHKERLIHDIVAYLLSFTSTKEPASLVTEGFPINHLGGHVDFDYGKVDTKFRDQHQFSTSPIGIAYSNYQLEKKSRGIHMWLNGRIIAGACLNFVKADESRQSTISRMGGSLPRKESESSFVELYNLFFNPQFPINSFFVPLLEYCIERDIELRFIELMNKFDP